MADLARIILGLWLLTVAVLRVFNLNGNNSSLGLFALVAGGVLLAQTPHIARKRGLLFLAVFLLFEGLAAWLPLPFEAFISAALAAAAAVLLALDSKPLTRQLRVLTLVLFLFAFAAARVSGLPVEGAALGILAGAAGVLMLIKK